jgi:hypothetical protein
MVDNDSSSVKNKQIIENKSKFTYCCEIGCWNIVTLNSKTICNSCKKPMCYICKDHSIKFQAARGRCDQCCWDEIT